jgi:hypothetical protein
LTFWRVTDVGTSNVLLRVLHTLYILVSHSRFESNSQHLTDLFPRPTKEPTYEPGYTGSGQATH